MIDHLHLLLNQVSASVYSKDNSIEMSSERDNNVFMAKLAEQAER